jgi:hypothetical protein
VEPYAVAGRYPMVARSQWFKDVFRDEIAAAMVPPEVVAAQARGRVRVRQPHRGLSLASLQPQLVCGPNGVNPTDACIENEIDPAA